jgi:uncharacterized protein YegP (UPF0339 family)
VAAKFEIRSPMSGEFNWVLLSQGRTLATGESYTSKAAAEKAIASMRSAAAAATVVDLTLPPAKTPVGKAARATGRAVGRAVVRSGQAVEQVEQTVAQAATEVSKAAKTTVKKAKISAKKTAKKAKAVAKKAKTKKAKGRGKKTSR